MLVRFIPFPSLYFHRFSQIHRFWLLVHFWTDWSWCILTECYKCGYCEQMAATEPTIFLKLDTSFLRIFPKTAITLSFERYSWIPETILRAVSIFKLFKPYFLGEICKEILIHSPSCHFALEVLLVELQLRFLYLFHSLFQLFHPQTFTGAIISVICMGVAIVENVMLVVYKLASQITQRDFFKHFWPTNMHRINYSLTKEIHIDDKKNHIDWSLEDRSWLFPMFSRNERIF